MTDSYKYMIENGPDLKGDVVIIQWNNILPTIVVLLIPLILVLIICTVKSIPTIVSDFITLTKAWLNFNSDIDLFYTIIFTLWIALTITAISTSGVGPIQFHPVLPFKEKQKRRYKRK